MNMMRTFARLGKRVVLVDADLRRSMILPQYGGRLQKDAQFGLTHYLAGMCSAEEVLCQTNIPGAYMVPVGREVNSSLSLLTTGKARQAARVVGHAVRLRAGGRSARGHDYRRGGDRQVLRWRALRHQLQRHQPPRDCRRQRPRSSARVATYSAPCSTMSALTPTPAKSTTTSRITIRTTNPITISGRPKAAPEAAPEAVPKAPPGALAQAAGVRRGRVRQRRCDDARIY